MLELPFRGVCAGDKLLLIARAEVNGGGDVP